MSRSKQTISGAAADASESHSVLDFLYNDSRRIGSFLSQFEVGHLQQITQTKEAERAKTDTSETSAKGGLPGVAGGGYKQSQQASLSAAEGSSRVYDPLWSNARAFLDHLSERELIQPDLDAAGYGHFVMITGWLTVLDLAMFKEAWNLKMVQKFIRAGTETEPAGNRHERRSGTKKSTPQNDEVELMLEMMQLMPHSVHASIMASDGEPLTAWGALREEFLVTPANELVLTHGATIPGEWTLIGLLNGRPDMESLELPAYLKAREELPPGLVDSLVGRVVQQLAPHVRMSLGRPVNSYAVTPLLIFREVSMTKAD